MRDREKDRKRGRERNRKGEGQGKRKEGEREGEGERWRKRKGREEERKETNMELTSRHSACPACARPCVLTPAENLPRPPQTKINRRLSMIFKLLFIYVVWRSSPTLQRKLTWNTLCNPSWPLTCVGRPHPASQVQAGAAIHGLAVSLLGKWYQAVPP